MNLILNVVLYPILSLLIILTYVALLVLKPVQILIPIPMLNRLQKNLEVLRLSIMYLWFLPRRLLAQDLQVAIQVLRTPVNRSDSQPPQT